MVTRRRLLQTTGSLGIAVTLAGCSESGVEGESETTPTESPEPTEAPQPQVDVGPEKRLRYDPEEIEINVGDTVAWIAKSPGHNVTSHPDASPKCENPEDVEPFTSYEGDDHFATMEVDERYEHEFTVPGEYVYVCTPHAGQEMVGTVIVTE